MSFKDKEHVYSEDVNVVKIYPEDKKTAIELLEPTSESSKIKKFLANNGKGIHHIALTVDNISNAIQFMNEKLNIYFFLPNFIIGGASRSIFNICKLINFHEK